MIDEKEIKEMLDHLPIWKRDRYRLMDLRRFTEKRHTPFVAKIDDDIDRELKLRKIARENADTFNPKDYVVITEDIPYWPIAASIPPFAGLEGRVIAMREVEGESGYAEVSFPPQSLGFGGYKHVRYNIPVNFLRKK